MDNWNDLRNQLVACDKPISGQCSNLVSLLPLLLVSLSLYFSLFVVSLLIAISILAHSTRHINNSTKRGKATNAHKWLHVIWWASKNFSFLWISVINKTKQITIVPNDMIKSVFHVVKPSIPNIQSSPTSWINNETRKKNNNARSPEANERKHC